MTGIYKAKVSVGGAKFQKSLKVETVKPNRIKMKLDFDDEIFSLGKKLHGQLQLNWLHGAAAKNLRASVKAKVVNTTTRFKGYESYLFNDPTRDYRSEEIELFNKKVDEFPATTIALTEPI